MAQEWFQNRLFTICRSTTTNSCWQKNLGCSGVKGSFFAVCTFEFGQENIQPQLSLAVSAQGLLIAVATPLLQDCLQVNSMPSLLHPASSLSRSMKCDWNQMARENPYYYVVTWDEFSSPTQCDTTAFFESGKKSVAEVLGWLQVQPQRDWSVLEIGCGLGRLTRTLNGMFDRVVGVDVSSEMIHRARQLTPELDVREVNGINLSEFPDQSFDLVFSILVLQHLPSESTVLSYIAEMARVLKPNSRALFQVPTSFHPRWKRIYWNLIQPKEADPNRNRASFRGCCLTAGTVQRYAFRHGLTPELVRDEGSYYTYFKLVKSDR